MNKKLIILIVVVFVLIALFLCGLCGGGAFWFVSSMSKTASEVKSGVLYDVCVAWKDDDYSGNGFEFFTERFLEDIYSYDEETFDELFPKDFDCDELKKQNLLDIFKRSVKVSVENDIKTVIITLNDKTVTVISEDGDDYKIDDID